MIFCSECFRNLEIKAIIEERGTLGVCPICGSKDVPVFDTEQDSTLFGMFDNLISIYTAESDLPKNYPVNEQRTLVDAIKNEWDIFSDIPDDTILEILKSLSPTVLNDYPIVFEMVVGLPEKYDKDFLLHRLRFFVHLQGNS